MSRTQEAIVTAYADLIEELGTDDVSFRLIARRAGVSERTVFRSYGTRTDLLLATAAWIERRIFTREHSPSVFDAPLAIRSAMHAYAERPELAHVVAEATMRGVAGATPTPRRAELDQLLAQEAPSVDEAERRAVSAALSHIDSAAMWVSLRRELGMDARDIADAAAWAAEAVLDPIRDRVG
ncbi:TetR/AcrR family transcriptional regulator [Microbacterium ulmi]|uniref:TetR/AcrR family transcriptional regulator n=2 Tax=Microbacterium ulmi TaxID=179095 RepID=A0A7Y2Q0R1_9MICO|nr:TetR/AcrR family transcriptional regulator [Microbacterium ulmi]NNH03552.1 TetR/AcrR family transcriptional regulator [Microbacterium ulmi]